MNSRERVYRALEFNSPDRAPRALFCTPWVEMFADNERKSLLEDFPPDFTGPNDPVLAAGSRCTGTPNRRGSYTDAWGCRWNCLEDGIIGEAKESQLADASALLRYQPPWEILEKADWDAVSIAQQENLRAETRFMLCISSVRPFERMQFLRGTERLLLDMAYDAAEFRTLLEMVHDFYRREIAGWAA